jgi:hypothetical protein
MNVDIGVIFDTATNLGLIERTAFRIAAEEAFMRRAAIVNGPFALKGSYVTRQYLKEGWKRIPGDLDWIATEPLDVDVLTKWVTAVTETDADDGIHFRSFSENQFWENMALLKFKWVDGHAG